MTRKITNDPHSLCLASNQKKPQITNQRTRGLHFRLKRIQKAMPLINKSKRLKIKKIKFPELFSRKKKRVTKSNAICIICSILSMQLKLCLINIKYRRFNTLVIEKKRGNKPL